jgi:hypothetical protein
MIQWRKRNTIYTTYVSRDDEWQIRRTGRARNSSWNLLRARQDGDPYVVVGSFPTLNDAKASAEYRASQE